MNITKEQRSLLTKYGMSTNVKHINDVLSELDDKITEIGFNRDYSLNATGLKLQRLYDELYDQDNWICPVCDKQIEGSECIVICDVADRMVKPTVLPEGVAWNEEQRKICKACKWHNM